MSDHRTDREIRNGLWTERAQQLLKQRGALENPPPLAECIGKWLSAAEAAGQGRRSRELAWQVNYAIEKLQKLQIEIEESTTEEDRTRAEAFLRGETPEW